jgi:hypothetical protein
MGYGEFVKMASRSEFATYVYAIKCGDYVKVGLAENTDTRLAALRLTCPYPMELLCRRQFPDKDTAWKREKALHRQLAGQRLWGEWFALAPLDPVQAICDVYEAWAVTNDGQRVTEAIDPRKPWSFLHIPYEERVGLMGYYNMNGERVVRHRGEG